MSIGMNATGFIYSHFVVENIFMSMKLAILLRINRESYV